MLSRSLIIAGLALGALLFLLPEDLAAQRGGRGISRGGGSRGSIGRSRGSSIGRSRGSSIGRSRGSSIGRSRGSSISRSPSIGRSRGSGYSPRRSIGRSRSSGLSRSGRSSGLSSRSSTGFRSRGSSRSRGGYVGRGGLTLGTTRTTPSRRSSGTLSGRLGAIRGRGATTSRSRSGSLSTNDRATRSSRGLSRSRRGTSGATGSSRSRSSAAARRGAPADSRVGRKRRGEGFSGFQSGRGGRSYRSSSDYRADLARRTGGSRSHSASHGHGHGHGHGHHGSHHHGRSWYLHFGFPYFGFGFGHNSFYARVVWGYPYYWWPHCYSHYYYPYWGWGYYPYYCSYRYYPIYRTVYVYGGGYGDSADGYWAGRGQDDPYVEPEAPPGEEEFEEDEPPAEDDGADAEESSAAAPIEPIEPDEAAALSAPLADDVDAGASHDAAVAVGDRYLRDGWGMKAAEAYRQAWQHEARDDTLLRLAVALLDGGDYPLASWALVRAVGSMEKRVLDYTVALDDLLGGPRITRATESLEKYLVDDPNDEASNLQLGALYVVTGREYAGYVVLTRLRAAEYETATVDLFIKQAKLALGK